MNMTAASIAATLIKSKRKIVEGIKIRDKNNCRKLKPGTAANIKKDHF